MLQEQRKRISFNQKDLTLLIYDNEESYQLYLKRQDIFTNDPSLRFNPTDYGMSRKDHINQLGKRFSRILEYPDLFSINSEHQKIKMNFSVYSLPLSLHGLMFLNSLQNLCDKEQQKTFLEPALRGEITGCYAQTELAHGSDVQNLMTTATYDEAIEGFIINTSEIGASKWWIGELGIYCTHACIFAQLIIKNKRYGVHAFIVPIRDPKTHRVIQGVQAGDIGPKHGFNTKDNGYAIFKNVRIPRKNMLMKFHIVEKNGEYHRTGDEKISFATMLMTRSALVTTLYNFLSKASLIAVRYSLVRTQFKDGKGKQIPILNYQTQQQKVLPRISQTFAYMFAEKNLVKISNFVFAEAQQGRFDRLNEAHILTSAIKAIASYDALKAIEILRKSAGGHGFHKYSGMVSLLHEASPFYTLEGQFSVLMLQVARFMIKSLSHIQKGKKLPQTVAYLAELTNNIQPPQIKAVQELEDPVLLRNILVVHSCRSTRIAGEKIMKGIGQGLKEKQVWDHAAGIRLQDAGIAHSYLIIYDFFYQALQRVSNPGVKTVLTHLLLLYGIEKILENTDKFFSTESITAQSTELLQQQRVRLFGLIRPDALGIMEAFSYSDQILMSAIGQSGGKPYENLIDWAKRYNSLNQKDERDQVISAIKKAKIELKAKI